MLVVDSLRQLAHLLGGHVHGKNVQPLIVVEARHAFAGVGLIQVARDDHRIAAGFGRSFVGRRRNESDLFAVGRPGHVLPAARQGTVGAAHLLDESCDLGAIRSGEEQSVFVTDSALKRQPFPIRRPAGIGRHIFFASDANGFLRGKIHNPKLRSGPARPVVQNHWVSNVMTVWR